LNKFPNNIITDNNYIKEFNNNIDTNLIDRKFNNVKMFKSKNESDNKRKTNLINDDNKIEKENNTKIMEIKAFTKINNYTGKENVNNGQK
jgi:hypothetical protein